MKPLEIIFEGKTYVLKNLFKPMIPKSARELVDFDYVEKLHDQWKQSHDEKIAEALVFLDKYAAAQYCGNTKPLKEIRDISIEQERVFWNENNARRRNVIAKKVKGDENV